MSASTKGKSGLQVVKRSIKEFSADDMTTYAAAVSYQVFFSLFPFIIFLLALLGLLRIPGFFDLLLTQSQAVLPEQAYGLFEDIVNQVRGQAAGGILSFGVIVALWSASSAVRMMMHAMNVAYDVDAERPAWKKIPLSILYTLLLAAMLIVAVGLIVLGGQVAQWFSNVVGFGLGGLFVPLWTWLRIPVAVVLLVMILALIYDLFPNFDQPFRLITPGATLAVIVWIAASLGFSFYVKNFSSYSATYGAVAAVIVILLYFFISTAIVLFGAEVNAEVYRELEESDGETEEKAG